MTDANPVNIYEYEEVARTKLGKGEYDFIAGAATDEITLRRTRAVLDSIVMKPRMLVDISDKDMSTTVLGQEISFPVMLDPAGNHSAAHPDAELATARAAGSAGTLMVLSAQASRTLEEVSQAASGPIWYQQYFFKDRGLTLEMARRAEEAGYSALCLTVDAKVKPKRERNIRNNYQGPASPNYDPSLNVGGSSWTFGLDAPSGAATYEDLDWLASNTRLPLVVKGIMVAEDGYQSAEHGAKAVIVSNHGTRYLDTTFATIEVLPEVVDAVNGNIEVYMDGGIRRGSDVFKALALGARAVLIGRPLFWGLAVDGEDGVKSVLEMLRDELEATMGMCGKTTVESIDRDSIATVSPLLSLFPTGTEFR
ncbi:Peroxisomal (S)-2-hydroxy-acid oxidase GLO4 [Geodia barretti]|uniref:(S)-2-hydroxy-acid oxidase n=1 Tax=Geodia barretti TaxID=519541 RepID=A0AA35XH25_GEOBA|nr:Peroxisomal (S)-2-hydroxy-acid oxidase GLO4 [Geodia barretti]